MSTSLQAQCPTCGKYFSSDSATLQHMNSPHTSCQSWLQFVASMAQEDPSCSTAGHSGPNSETNANASGGNENASNHDTLVDTRYEDIHPNTPLFFGSGPTFMDRFDTDSQAGQRQENLYYPFLSREEWSLASWLLCSGLSMRAIDDFLALPIVSF